MSILSSQFSGALKNSFCCRLPPRLIARGLTMDSAKTTAGIIIIGDEILKGETQVEYNIIIYVLLKLIAQVISE